MKWLNMLNLARSAMHCYRYTCGLKNGMHVRKLDEKHRCTTRLGPPPWAVNLLYGTSIKSTGPRDATPCYTGCPFSYCELGWGISDSPRMDECTPSSMMVDGLRCWPPATSYLSMIFLLSPLVRSREGTFLPMQKITVQRRFHEVDQCALTCPVTAWSAGFRPASELVECVWCHALNRRSPPNVAQHPSGWGYSVTQDRSRELLE
jgi:hypothetical protein